MNYISTQARASSHVEQNIMVTEEVSIDFLGFLYRTHS